LTVGSDADCHAARDWRSPNAGDKGPRLGFLRADADGILLDRDTFILDINIIIARGEITTGAGAQGRVTKHGAGGLHIERISANGCIPVAVDVANERIFTDSSVAASGGVVSERRLTVGRVVVAGVVKNSVVSGGRVESAGCVAIERLKPSGGVVVSGVAVQRLKTSGCVVVAGRVQSERSLTVGRVLEAGCVVKER